MSGGLSWFQHPVARSTAQGEPKLLEDLGWQQAETLNPERVSMTPEVGQKLGAAPPPLFEAADVDEFPIMHRMVQAAMEREEALWRAALGRLLADLPAEDLEQEDRMAKILVAADRFAGISRISVDEALGLFQRVAERGK